jgi:N6-L-threonylcarbamoyladenine synthase
MIMLGTDGQNERRSVFLRRKVDMKILGIDTSCDDTSAAIVADGDTTLSNVVNSQVKLHHPYGGVVPELASREHVRNIVPVVDEALSKAGITANEIDGIAVTVGPGLIGSLLVGLYFAKGLAYVNKIPMVAVNHLEGHILSIMLEDHAPEFPFVALTVSGGHTSLYHVKDFGDYGLMGQTLDDAAGEAFDKVAKILGLGYPGGPIIEQHAKSGKGDAIKFPRAVMGGDSLDFSFSGLKTAVSLHFKKWEEDKDLQRKVTVDDIAASFQEAVIDVLVKKLCRAREKTGVDRVVVAGGVACNRTLREQLNIVAREKNFSPFYPRSEFCTDNGAMIALSGFHRIKRGETDGLSIDVRSRFPISDLAPLKA